MSASSRYETRRYVVAMAAEVPEGGHVLRELGGRTVGIFRVDGEYHAIRHRCPHLGGPLCDGAIIGLVESDGPGDVRLNDDRKMLACPWHGWEFDLRTGQSYFDPVKMRARHYPVTVEDGRRVLDALASGAEARVPGPYQAETFPVSVEGEYLVVTMREPVPAPVTGAPAAGTPVAGAPVTGAPVVSAKGGELS